MKQANGWMIPDGDTHLEGFLPQRGIHARALFRGMSHCVGFRVAVDIGAHIGLWSKVLGQFFRRVTALEPRAENRQCFEKNVTWKNVRLLPYAAGEKCDKVTLYQHPDFSMKSHVRRDAVGVPIEMVDIDSLDLTDVDFIKFDCEGYDAMAVAGAERTIRTSLPVVVVEQVVGVPSRRYGLTDMAAVDLLKSWGYAMAAKVGSDYIMIPSKETK